MFINLRRIIPHQTWILLVIIIQVSVSDYWIVEACLNVWLLQDQIKIKDVSILSIRSTSKLASSKWIPSIIRNALQDNIFDFTLTNNSNSIHNSAQHTRHHTRNICFMFQFENIEHELEKQLLYLYCPIIHRGPAVFKSLKVIMAFPFAIVRGCI